MAKRTRTPAALAAAVIRKELKKNNIKARVTSENYSMGSSIRIAVENQLPATVEKIKAFVSKYQMGSFDGMTDSYNYNNTDDSLPQAKFIFVENSFSDEMKIEAENWLNKKGITIEFNSVFMVLNGANDYGFWTAKKERVKI